MTPPRPERGPATSMKRRGLKGPPEEKPVLGNRLIIHPVSEETALTHGTYPESAGGPLVKVTTKRINRHGL